jgi:hypothetical protein
VSTIESAPHGVFTRPNGEVVVLTDAMVDLIDLVKEEAAEAAMELYSRCYADALENVEIAVMALEAAPLGQRLACAQHAAQLLDVMARALDNPDIPGDYAREQQGYNSIWLRVAVKQLGYTV